MYHVAIGQATDLQKYMDRAPDESSHLRMGRNEDAQRPGEKLELLQERI
jgi:hypothetical protein